MNPTPREESIIRAAYADGLHTGWAIRCDDADLNTSDLADRYINEAIADNGGTAAQMICTDAPDDDHKAALAEKELALADYERITTLQMAQNRRQEAELEKARELLKEVLEIARDNTLECFNEHMQNYGPRDNMIQRNIDTSDQLHKEMNRIDEIASYLGDKS